MDLMANMFRDTISKVAQLFPNRQDWALVIQPILSQGKIPNINYLSTLDCFHPSLIGHRALAISIWNSMLLPKSQKPSYWNPDSLWPLCPNNSTVFFVD